MRVKVTVWIRDGAGELDQGGPLIQLAQECELVVPRSLVWPIVKHAFLRDDLLRGLALIYARPEQEDKWEYNTHNFF